MPCSGVSYLGLHTQCSFWDLFGAEIRPHSQSKKLSFIPIPNWWEKFPNLGILKNSERKCLKALKTEHFLNVFRPSRRSECFPKRQNSNLTKFMNIWRQVLHFSYFSTFPNFLLHARKFPIQRIPSPFPKCWKGTLNFAKVTSKRPAWQYCIVKP